MTLILASNTAHAQLRKVAFTGEEAPGAPAGAKFLAFSIPSINDTGETLFFGALEIGPGGITSANERGYWSEVTGALDLVALEGDPAPGTGPGVLFSHSFDAMATITDNHVILGNQLPIGVAGVTANDNYGLWKGDGSSLNLAFREGAQPPGTPVGAQFSGFFPLINRHGQTTVLGSLRAGFGGITLANDRGIWTDRSGAVTLITRESIAPPGMPSAVNESLTAPIMNDLGHIAWAADLLEGMGGITVNDDQMIWSDRDGAFSIIYREGQTAPGVPGSKFESLFAPQINGIGRLAFVGEMKEGEGGVTADNKKALWAEDGVGLQLLARQGAPTPGAPGFVYTDINSSWISLPMNDSGGVAYVALIDGPGFDDEEQGIWSTGSGSLEMIMRTGLPAPDTDPGITFLSVQNTLSLRLNKLGQTAFGATVQGTGVTGANDFGIWAQDTDGELQMIAREGQLVEIAPGDSRHISLLQFGEFNDRGELTFTAGFAEGGQGVFVSTLVATLGLDGDYNQNDIVDSADYTVWRDAMTAGLTSLPNRDPMKTGLVDESDFLYWRARFGNTPDQGSGSGVATVPEPCAGILIVLGGLLLAAWGRGRVQ